MKTCLLAMLSLLVASPSLAQFPYTEQQVIEYAKSIDVKTLDPSLPTQRLEDWLQKGPPHAHVRWEADDSCGLEEPEVAFPNGDWPICAKVWFYRDGQGGYLLVQVGTAKKGIVGRPRLDQPFGVWEEVTTMTGYSERLSDLPALLAQPAYARGVMQLFDEIVARHPIGIPTGADMTAIRPLLSKRLAERLQSAKACEADYFAQRQQGTDGDAKPAWLKGGLFTGAGNRASPASAWAEREGPQKDGSFLVSVNLFAQTINLGNGLVGGADTPNGVWHVTAKVISEDGRFVVDDVRLPDGPAADGPSHLLSDSFAGCDGPRWVGEPARSK